MTVSVPLQVGMPGLRRWKRHGVASQRWVQAYRTGTNHALNAKRTCAKPRSAPDRRPTADLRRRRHRSAASAGHGARRAVAAASSRVPRSACPLCDDYIGYTTRRSFPKHAGRPGYEARRDRWCLPSYRSRRTGSCGTRLRCGIRTYLRSLITEGAGSRVVAECSSMPSASACSTSAFSPSTRQTARCKPTVVSGSYVMLSSNTRRTYTSRRHG